jgi:ketol-acid reductoisomerase
MTISSDKLDSSVITESDLRKYQLADLSEKVISVIGYGNQGRSQAMNLRDSGLKIYIGNNEDDYSARAREDKFDVLSIEAASEKADIIFLLLPDEIQKEVFEKRIAPNLKKGSTVVFASGYNYFYGYVKPPAGTTVLMIAPRMIGWGVRDLFLKDKGFPVLVSVGNDPNGTGLQTLFSLCNYLGVFKKGGVAVMSSFREETLVDLLSEHTWAGAILYIFRAYYEVATSLGASPEAVILDLYGSGELAEIAESMKDMGLFKQLKTHSPTSQYGQLTRGPQYADDRLKEIIKREALDILNGSFAREWTNEKETGMVVYDRLHEMSLDHEMEREERKLYSLLGRV